MLIFDLKRLDRSATEVLSFDQFGSTHSEEASGCFMKLQMGMQIYVQMSELARPAIEAVGRCVLKIGTVADSCLSVLIKLIASPRQQVVCSVVVVLKRLLHENSDVKLFPRVMKLIHFVKTSTRS